MLLRRAGVEEQHFLDHQRVSDAVGNRMERTRLICTIERHAVKKGLPSMIIATVIFS